MKKAKYFRNMKFSVVGTGNVATHFTRMLTSAGHELVSVCGSSVEKAEKWATSFPSCHVKEAAALAASDGLILLCVKDDAIHELDQIISSELCCIHTSGFTDLNQLQRSEKAVLWPLQTLTAGKIISYNQLPIAYEASSLQTEKLLLSLLEGTGVQAFMADSEQRKHLHLAAVVACNFTNHLYTIAFDYLQAHSIDPKVLLPLIAETAEKVKSVSPRDAQTGPAIREDYEVVKRQTEMLSQFPQWQKLYQLFSEAIIASKKNKP